MGGRGKGEEGFFFFFSLLLTMLALNDVCVCVYMCVYGSETEGLNISMQSSQHRHFHSRWSDSPTIWRP